MSLKRNCNHLPEPYPYMKNILINLYIPYQKSKQKNTAKIQDMRNDLSKIFGLVVFAFISLVSITQRIPKAIKLTIEIMSDPIKATIIMVSLSSVVIFFQGMSLPRLPVTTQLIIISTPCAIYFKQNNLVSRLARKVLCFRILDWGNGVLGCWVTGRSGRFKTLQRHKRQSKPVFFKPLGTLHLCGQKQVWTCLRFL